MTKLQILICTFGRRIDALALDRLPELPEAGYIISWQNPDGLPAPSHLDRHDIDIHIWADRGLSRNRNHAFDVATAPYLLISDDDITYRPDGIRELIDCFDSDSSLMLATFRARTEADGRTFPADGHDLSVGTRFYYPISFEIAVRRSLISDHGYRFSELAGIGAPVLGCGEENLLVHHIAAAGWRSRFFDIEIAEHHGPTTSEHSAAAPSTIMAKGAVMTVMRGLPTALSRIPVEAWRMPAPFFKNMYYLFRGICYALRHRSEL